MRTSILAFLLLLAGLLASGCDDVNRLMGGDDGAAEAAEDGDAPPANVNLPPVPSLDLLDVPKQYPDGAWSVIGAIQNKDSLFGETLTIQAILIEQYKCDVPANEDTDGEAAGTDKPGGDSAEAAANPNRPGCLRPHLYLADTESGTRRLLATGYDHRLYDSQLQEGLRYAFTGSYREASAGFSSSDGLLVVDRIEGNGIVQQKNEAPGADQ